MSGRGEGITGDKINVKLKELNVRKNNNGIYLKVTVVNLNYTYKISVRLC